VSDGATLKIYGSGKGEKQLKDSLYGGGDGAIIAKDESTVILKDIEVFNNTAGRNGGGIYLGSKVRCDLFNVTVRDNKAGNCGGGIYVAGKQTNITFDAKTRITENTADDGAGIYVNCSNVNLYGPARGKVRVENNEASGSGGGFYFNDSEIKANGFELYSNKAGKWAGGVMMESTGTSLADSEIKYNASARDGGGVYINGKVGTLTDVVIEDNKCGKDYNGGGVYVDSMDNVSTGGKFYVYGNYRGDTKSDDKRSDLYLQNGKATDAYIHAAAYSPGSKIGIGVTDWNEGQRLTFEPGNFNPKLFEVNGGLATRANNKSTKDKRFYVALNSDRHLVLTSNKNAAYKAPEPEYLKNRNSNKREVYDSGLKITAGNNEEYDVLRGFSAFPSYLDPERDLVLPYYYSDGYFFDDPKTYNSHLATFALHLIGAAADSNIGGTEDYSYKFNNVKDMMIAMGCRDEDVWISPSYIVKPTTDSIGVAIGKKTIKSSAGEYTLVPISIRSWGYESEWGSNVTLNGSNVTTDGGEASGFKDAATQVVQAVKSYAGNYGLDAQLSQGKVKFLVTGYSRGGATANIASKMLTDTYGELSDKYKAKPNQVFGYCFAVPQGGADLTDNSLKRNRTGYHNIHNIINNVDLVPFVAPSQMGFKHYGVDHFIPGDTAGNVKTYINYATEINGGHKITSYYDNNRWDVGSSAYNVQKAAMLKQLMYIDDNIFFVDRFKETDLNVGVWKAVGAKIRGMFTETPVVTMEEVKSSTKTQREWLGEFFAAFQNLNTTGAADRLTRYNYSNKIIRAGKTAGLKDNETKWGNMGATAQAAFRVLVPLVFSKSPEDAATMMAAFSGLGNKLGTWELKGVYDDLLNDSKGWDDSQKIQQKYLNLFWNKLTDDSYGQKAIQNGLTNSELKDLKNVFPSIMSIAMRLVNQDFMNKEHKGYLRLFGTLGANVDTIALAHVPEVYLAWLQSYDTFYNSSPVNDKPYRWAASTVTPGKAEFILSENKVEGTVNSLSGSSVLKIRSDNPTDSVLYTIKSDEGGNNGEPVTMLYNEKQGIVLNAPKGEGEIIYTVNAWTVNCDSDKDGNITWRKGSKTGEYAFKVKKAQNAEKDNIIIEDIRIRKEDGSYLRDLERIHHVTDTPYAPEGENSLDLENELKKIPKLTAVTGDDVFKHYFAETVKDYGNASVQSGVKIFTYTPKENTRNASQKLSIELIPKVTAVNLKGNAYLKLKPDPKNGKEFVNKLGKNEYGLRYGKLYTSDGRLPATVTWTEKNANGEYVDVTTAKPEYGREYRAEITFKLYENSDGVNYTKVFEDNGSFTAFDGNNKIEASFMGADRTVKATLNFSTVKDKIKYCGAGEALNEAEAFIWKEENVENARKSAADSFPKYSGMIETVSGVKIQGCTVDWDTSTITQEKLNEGNDFDILGTIRHDTGKAAGFADYDWDDWKNTNSLSEFQVKGRVHVIERSQLKPPAPDVISGNYTFDIGQDFMADDGGNMLVTLSDPNIGVEGTLIQYKLKKTTDQGSVEFTNYNEPVSLEKPAEGMTVSYDLIVKCSANEVPGYIDSKEVTYKYTLRTPELRKVYAFTHDINEGEEGIPGDVEDKLIATVEKGDRIAVDYDEIAGEDEDYEGKDLVYWNAITKKEDGSPSINRVSGNDTIIEYPVSGNDLYLQALTAPIADYVDIELEKPETGESLPDMPEEIEICIAGERIELDPSSVSIDWIVPEDTDDDGLVRSKSVYTAVIAVSADQIKDIYMDPVGLKYFADEETDVYVNGTDRYGISGNEAGIDSITAVTETDDDGLADCIYVYITYEETADATFLGVEAPDGLEVSFDKKTYNDRYEKDIKPALPSRAAVIVDDGSIQTLSVNWVEDGETTITDESGQTEKITGVVAYEAYAYEDTEGEVPGYPLRKEDLNGLDDLNIIMEGYVTIPDELYIEVDEKGDPVNENIVSENGVWNCYFEYPVTLEGAPVSAAPEILPPGGEYEPSANEILIDFNTFPISNSENSVKVYYKISYHNENDEDDDPDYDPLCWYDEKGNLEVDPDPAVHVYYPGKEYDLSKESDIKEQLEELASRTITRETLEERNADYARVTAVAVEEGIYRISDMSEEYYFFYDKPVADIPDETLEALCNLTIESGSTLSTIELPENCSWDESVDPYKVQDGPEGGYVEAMVKYNDAPDERRDLLLGINIEIISGYYSITTTDCTAFTFDEDEADFSEGLERITKAKAGSAVYISADTVPEEFKDCENAGIADWIVIDRENDDIEYEFDPGDNTCIGIEMPYSDIYVRPIWYDASRPVAAVASLTLDKSFIELKKGGSDTITADAVYSGYDEDAYKEPVSFSSSDTSVAEVTVDQRGVATVKAVGSGRAVIFASCRDKSASCVVSVGEVYLDLQLTDCKAYDTSESSNKALGDTVAKGTVIRLEADKAVNESLSFKEWTINGADIDKTKNPVTFTVNTDLVAKAEYGIAPGFEDPGDYAYGNIRIKSLTLTDPDTDKKISKAVLPLNKSVSVSAKAVYTGQKPPILFKSSNTDVVRVKTVSGNDGQAQGVLVGCRPGTAVVTACCGNKTAKLNVTVGDRDVTGVVITGNRLANNTTDDGQYQLELNTGEQELLEVLPNPIENVAETKITWRSDDPKVATVRNGLVTARLADKGHTTITATVKTKPLGETKWVTLKPVKIVVRVRQIETPKKLKTDKSYNITLKSSQNLDLNASRIGKKNVLSGCTVNAKLKGNAPADLIWESTNENIVKVTQSDKDRLSAYIQGTGIGTAYVVLKGLNADKTVTNQAVMKVTVKAGAPELQFTNDALGELVSEDGRQSLTLKQGSYDRLYYSIYTNGVDVPHNIATERVTWSGSGGVIVKDGVIYAKNASKNGKTAKVILKCGRSRIELPVTVK